MVAMFATRRHRGEKLLTVSCRPRLRLVIKDFALIRWREQRRGATLLGWLREAVAEAQIVDLELLEVGIVPRSPALQPNSTPSERDQTRVRESGNAAKCLAGIERR